jgi:lipopolysaccharide transport system permease protein
MMPLGSMHTPEVVYSPESSMRRPRQLFSGMMRDLHASRELAWLLFVRNIRAQYRQTLLGYFWAIFPPLVTSLTFIFLNSQKIINVSTTKISYPAFILVGVLLWQGFVDAMNTPIRLVNSSVAMITKINFPREALVMAGLYEVILNFVIRLALVFLLLVWRRDPISWTALMMPLGALSIIGLGLMFGLLLAPLGVLYQDIGRGLSLLTSLWFFMTPVIYPAPTTWPACLLGRINPVSPLLVTTREWLDSNDFFMPASFVLVAGLTFILLLAGWILYRLAMPRLVERMSA